MKITILCPAEEFTAAQQKRLARLGDVVYTKNRDEYPMEELIAMSKDADILAVDPANLGGWEVVAERLKQLMEAIPNLRGLPLDTTSFGHVDQEYCRKRGIVATHTPGYSTESVAEHALCMLLGCAKRFFLTDRRTQRGEYQLVQGFELKEWTLGIIGLGRIGTRVAELGQAIGMKVIAWNRSPKSVPGVEVKPLDDVLSLAECDAIAITIADHKETEGLLSRERIARLKDGAIVVNTTSRFIVDEEAMAEALRSGKVDSYAFEAEDLDKPPLGDVENAFAFKGFGWYTREALARNKEMWVDNIEAIVKGVKPPNPLPG